MDLRFAITQSVTKYYSFEHTCLISRTSNPQIATTSPRYGEQVRVYVILSECLQYNPQKTLCLLLRTMKCYLITLSATQRMTQRMHTTGYRRNFVRELSENSSNKITLGAKKSGRLDTQPRRNLNTVSRSSCEFLIFDKAIEIYIHSGPITLYYMHLTRLDLLLPLHSALTFTVHLVLSCCRSLASWHQRTQQSHRSPKLWASSLPHPTVICQSHISHHMETKTYVLGNASALPPESVHNLFAGLDVVQEALGGDPLLTKGRDGGVSPNRAQDVPRRVRSVLCLRIVVLRISILAFVSSRMGEKMKIGSGINRVGCRNEVRFHGSRPVFGGRWNAELRTM
jgi:hypothetical protein